MRLNQHTLLAALAALLLPMPLVWLLWDVMPHPPGSRALDEGGVSPMLGFEERQRLQTYHRDCTKPADCQPPLGCLSNIRARKHYCSDSQCLTDMQCPEGFVCRTLPTLGGGPRVRQCIPPGIRKEGEPCINLPPSQDFACAPDLLCGGGWCGRPCQRESPSSCPAGFFCADVTPGPACQPTCEGRTCPAGQQCIHDDKGASTCVVVHGSNCQQLPCAEGRRCVALFGSRRAGQVWMACSPECGRDGLTCAEGLVCDRGSCLAPCEPEGPNVCEPGYRCLRLNDQQPWLCRPDM